MNNIILVGNLTKDVEIGETGKGIQFAKFSVAVKRQFKENEADFFNVVVWRELAENCARYLNKGNKVAVNGRIEMRTYEDKSKVKRIFTEVIANEVEFLTPKATDTKAKLEDYNGDEESPF